jgi:hypothetical protein
MKHFSDEQRANKKVFIVRDFSAEVFTFAFHIATPVFFLQENKHGFRIAFQSF